MSSAFRYDDGSNINSRVRGDDDGDGNEDVPLSRLVRDSGNNNNSGHSASAALVNVMTRGGASSVAASAPPLLSSSSSAPRGSDLRDLLLNTEREMADLREECALRGSEIESLKAALQREHEGNLRMRTQHQSQMDDLRDEYERQQGQLVEQVTVLKGLCESALQDKHRVADEAHRSKTSLLNLIEKEREEKANVIAEYRQQTEALIAEQGREITGLRQLLEMARTEEDKLLALISANETRSKDMEGTIAKEQSALSDERIVTQRKIRELELQHTTALQAEKDRCAVVEQQLRSEILRLSTARDTQNDASRSLNERLALMEQQFETERKRLKESYQSDLAKLQEEVRAVKERHDRDVESHRRTMQTQSAQDETVVASLRRNLEVLRAERVAEADDQRLQRESITADFTSKLNAAKAQIDSLTRDIADERNSRRDVESKHKSLVTEREALQSSINRLTAELEEMQVTGRTRERTAEQDHLVALNAVKDELREADSDNTLLRHQLKKVDMELQRLLDEVDGKQRSIEQLRAERNREREQHRSESDAVQASYDDYRRQSTKAIDTLHGQRIQLETEVGRLQRLQGETESRLSAANKQLVDERKALERSIADVQSLRGENSELRTQIDRSSKLNAELGVALGEKEETIASQDKHIAEMSTAMQAAKEQLERERSDAKKRAREYEDTVSSLHAAGRLQMEKAEAELHSAAENLRLARETIKTLEQNIRTQRDEVSSWQRECSSKDEAHADAIRMIRQQADDELTRMDAIINQLREDLVRAQQGKSQAQRDAADAQRDTDRRVAIIQEALEAERSSKLRLHDELRSKEQLTAELNGTLRLVNARLSSKDDEIHRLEHEVSEQMRKLHDAHSSIGKKDAIIGQLNAKIRVFEHSASIGGSSIMDYSRGGGGGVSNSYASAAFLK